MIGGPFGSSLVNNDYEPSGVPVIRGTNLGFGRRLGGDYAFVSEEKVASDLARNTAAPGDIVFTQRGTLGQVALVPDDTYPVFIVSQSQMRLRVDPAKAVSEYVYYACSSEAFIKQIDDNAISTGVPHINLGILNRLTIPLPPLPEQRAIAEVLGALDDKIAANTKLITRLDAHMALEYTAAVAEGALDSPLAAVAEFHNRRRVPLSAREREQRAGDIPYYGASGVFGTVNEAIFDEPLVLVGEDGSVINADGTPVVQYIWGPAWINNHAHVLTGKDISTELLYLAITRCQVATLVTGAVQPKINMGNLKRLVLELPLAGDRGRLEAIVRAETASKRAALEENVTLAATRDALLPQLMSGKLRVRDAEAVLEKAGV
ncbi:restriction endonuclease subunit S [Pseudarthrobacter sp. AB1]|nr:restriction endonuclease subunit S [Pseudarthrobacter sp. AB1]